jgi:hypothetical protein
MRLNLLLPDVKPDQLQLRKQRAQKACKAFEKKSQMGSIKRCQPGAMNVLVVDVPFEFICRGLSFSKSLVE